MSAAGAAVRTLAVLCPDWEVVAAGFEAADPRPVAVVRANRVVATNAAARADDVVVGARRREAQGRCPDLLIVAHDPARDARAFEPVVAALATLTPRVEITEPGVCSFATRGPSRYFGGDEALAQRAAAAAAGADPDLDVRVGVADGPLVARLAATRAGRGRPRVVPPGTAAAFLAPAPLAALATFVPDPDVLDTWERLGLTTIGEVGALPTGAVVARFGPAGQWVHRLARGLDPQLLRPEPVPPDVTVAADLDPPAERAEAVAFVARTLAEELVDRLGGWGLACTQVVVTAHTEHGETHERCWRLDGPARASGAPRSLAAAIADRARWQVDGWLSGPAAIRPTAGVSRLVLAPGSVEPARGRQLGFWGGEAGAGERVVRAVARLEGLVGPDAVRVAEARGGRRSGDEVGLVPTAAVDVSVARQVALTFGAAPWPGRLPAPSPSVVHRPARPAEVLDAEGRSVEVTGRGEVRRPPHTVRVEADPPHDVVAWAGPWPVDQRWWDAEAHERRARLQVVTDQGVALLLGRADGSWWVDAVYA